MQVSRITFHRNDAEGTDGSVLYLILSPCTERPCTHICATHPEMDHHYELQRFRRGDFGHRRNATPEAIAKDEANVWGWDGNDPPTILPSFLAKTDRPYIMHSHLRAGKIDLCADSTVRLVESTPCIDKQ